MGEPLAAAGAATDRATIEIAMAVDQGFAMPLAACLASIAATHDPGECAVSVLHTGLTPALTERIAAGLAGRVAVSWIPVNQADLAGAHFPVFLTGASLFRLLLPRMLPAGTSRTIYLDADTVVVSSLRPLWETDLGDNLAGAVLEACAPWAAGPSGTDWRALGLAPDAPYFNSGMLLIPLARWRQEDIAQHAFDVLRRTKPRWGDQCALNTALAGQWLQLPRRWNLQTADVAGYGLAWALWRDEVELAVADPAVIHFTERDKPWSPGTAHPRADEWYRFLDQTSWAGWRPGDAGQPLYRKLGSRAKRAARVLVTGS